MVSGEPMAATASTRSRQKDISSPVGQLLQKSLHLGDDEQQVPHVRQSIRYLTLIDAHLLKWVHEKFPRVYQLIQSYIKDIFTTLN